MTFRRSRSGYLHSALAAGLAGLALVAGGCATDGAGGGTYGGYDYDDAWYWGGCCVDPPQAIGPPPPHPEHPIAKPPPAGPSHPIATPPVSRPMPMPRPAAAPRGGRR